MVGFKTPEEAYLVIREWVSSLSKEDHVVRSTIFDIHAAIELELRRIMYHHNKSLLFLTGKKDVDALVLGDYEKTIDDLSFRDMFRILKPALVYWYVDLKNIEPINNLRNQVAHNSEIEKIEYKGRNPFRDPDSFAQVFVDAWAIRKCLEEFFFKAIDGPRVRCKEYYRAYEKYVLKTKNGSGR